MGLLCLDNYARYYLPVLSYAVGAPSTAVRNVLANGLSLSILEIRKCGHRSRLFESQGNLFVAFSVVAQAKDGCAELMQSFSIYKWQPNLGEIIGFERFHRHQWPPRDGDTVGSMKVGDGHDD